MEYTANTTVLGDWKIIKLIGEGANGKVYEIHKTEYGITTKAALKVIRVPQSEAEIRAALNEGMDDRTITGYFQGMVEEIVKEISVMASLKSCASIVSCEDYKVEMHAGDLGWDILIRMELLTSLQDYQRKHQMDEAEVVRMAKDLCMALVYCQKKGLIHRDIKPGNIFVNEDGTFKLGDFGVARTLEKTSGGLSKKGTEGYMAPEVYLGRKYGASVDIYSLGLVLYKSLNKNRLPFLPDASKMITFADRENALVRRMRGEAMAAPVDASDAFAEVILKACAFEPEKRYRTAAEMLGALEHLEKGETAMPASGREVAGSVMEPVEIPEEEKTMGMASAEPEEEKTMGMPSAELEEEKTIGMMSAELEEEKTIGMMSAELVEEKTMGMAAERVHASAAASKVQKEAPKKKKTGPIIGLILGLGACGAAGYWYVKPYFTLQNVMVFDTTVDMGQEGVWPGTTIGEYKKGEAVTVTAEEKFGWDFVKWTSLDEELDMEDIKAEDPENMTLHFTMPGRQVNLAMEYEAWNGIRTVEYEEGIYEGNYVDGLRSGIGRFDWTNGTVYEGEWTDDLPNGTGIKTYPEDETENPSGIKYYEGEWVDGEKSGTGIMVWLDGDHYEGEWTDDLPNGTGTYYYYYADGSETENPNGIKYYEGEWVDGEKSGTGIMVWLDGDHYEGEWKNDAKNGTGTYYYADGSYLEAEWVDGLPNGTGIMTYPEDETENPNGIKYYEGEWVDGEKSGTGIMVWLDGDHYEGEWKNDTKNGTGTYYYADGSYLEAEWVDGMPDGMCTRYYTDGTTEKLKYENGELVVNGFNVIVNNGSGSGIYEEGSTVTVKADDRSDEGLEFRYWAVKSKWFDDVETRYYYEPEIILHVRESEITATAYYTQKETENNTAEYTDDEGIVWKDAALETFMHRLFKKKEGEPIYKEELEAITDFHYWGGSTGISMYDEDFNIYKCAILKTDDLIECVDDFKYFPNLVELWLDGNQISNISALEGLINLESLDLSKNQISDISALEGLTNVSSLWLFRNQISDISALDSLTNLELLNLYKNQISDISALEGLINLESLDLSKNQISDISALEGLTNLKDLNLSKNQIVDISALEGLTNLEWLNLSWNNVTDISVLFDLKNLEYVSLYECPVSQSDVDALAATGVEVSY